MRENRGPNGMLHGVREKKQGAGQMLTADEEG